MAVDGVQIDEDVFARQVGRVELRVQQEEAAHGAAGRGAEGEGIVAEVAAVILGTDRESASGNQPAEDSAEAADAAGDAFDDALFLDGDEGLFGVRRLVGLEMLRLLLALELNLAGAAHRAMVRKRRAKAAVSGGIQQDDQSAPLLS